MLQKSMSREIQPDYETQYLFPRSLEEWVGPDHPARFVREFVDALDVESLGLTGEQQSRREDATGRPHYGVTLLLKVWLYGYMNRIRSSRALERACRDMLPLVWLAGTHVPDHNTLWRFWSRYRTTVRALFLQSVQIAMEQNLVGLVLQAVDGTKIKSVASKRRAWHGEDLKKALERIDAEIGKLEEQISAAGEQGDGTDDTLPKALQNRQELRSRIKSALKALDEAGRKRMHPLDPDARMMISHGRTEFAFNAQAVVDEEQGIIVAEDVTDQENDEQQLEPMLDQVKENLAEYAEITVADSGYHSAKGLGAAAASGAPVLVAVPIKDRTVGPFHKLRFTHDAETDSVLCPQQQRLSRIGTRRHKSKPTPLKTYRCTVASICPVASQCTNDLRGRIIEISPHHEAVVRNRNHAGARELLLRRQSVVERAFAEIKETLGMRRWTVRGLVAVKAQWTMICAAMNLRRMLAAKT
jgi:transposase